MLTLHLQEEKSIHRIFVISLVLKSVTSGLEIIGGILFLFAGNVTALLSLLISQELIEDPGDFVANQIQHFLPYFSTHSQLFGSFYLLSHGIIKIFLVINLLRGKLWAYPTTIVILFIFIAYQLYRLTYSFSYFLIFLTLFDMLIIWMTWHEYRIAKKHMPLY